MTSAHTLRNHVTSEACAPDRERGPTITATLDDGPRQGTQLEAGVVEGRPPSTVNVLADDGSTYRYCSRSGRRAARPRSTRSFTACTPTP